ncbi:MAG: divalent-cation tolerance protein CutA [Acidobacteria bacterium]|nr:divalent-cation tolerance protein CutA [Acidobacteriota bacterium]
MNEIIVLTTTDSIELAHKIASALVEKREAACVNIIPEIRSVYRWEGKICDEKEFLLVIKSTVQRLEAVKDRVRSLHTYQTPEVISIPVSGGDPAYLSWLHASVE